MRLTEAQELAALRAYAHEATKAITDLVGGGSECFSGRIGEMYLADLPYCKRRIKERESRAHERLLKAAQEKSADRESLKWRGMESAPKGEIVNVVGRYKHATAGYPRYAGFNEATGEWLEYSKYEPEPIVVWAWRPREDWPGEPALTSGSKPE